MTEEAVKVAVEGFDYGLACGVAGGFVCRCADPADAAVHAGAVDLECSVAEGF